MPNSFVTTASAIKAAFDTEFAPEGFVMRFDRLHESLGEKRVDVGIAPVEESVTASNALVSETILEVRFYDLWKTRQMSPDRTVDPTRITDFAERFKRCLRTHEDPRTGQTWYFDVRRVTYPPDPSGNTTRFHATVRALGNNSNLIETTG